MIARTIDAIAQRTDPVIEWIDHTGRLELTGKVFANWVYKSAGLMRDSDPELFVCAPAGPLHWRALACVFAACGSGIPVQIDSEVGSPDTDNWVGMVSVGDDTQAFADASELWVFDPTPLALSTDVEPGDTDFISAVRSFPDVTPLLDTPLTYTRDGYTVTAREVDGTDHVTVTSVPETDDELSQLNHALVHGHITIDLTGQ